MTKSTYIIISTILTFLTACNSDSDNSGQTKSTDSSSTNVSDSTFNEVNSQTGQPRSYPLYTAKISETHLHDTTTISGNYVLFLRPDSIRFEIYAKSEHSGIYEVDSDFGFGISEAIDSLTKNKKYSKIKSDVCTNRYVKILDSKNGLTLIDRDSVDYGFILTGPNKKYKYISSDQNIISSGSYYLQEIADFFKIKQ